MANSQESSIESRAQAHREEGSAPSSPALEVLNSALSLGAVVALTVVGSLILHAFLGRRSA